MERSAAYTLGFAAVVAVVASGVVATSAVVLEERQEANRLLDRRMKVLEVVGLLPAPDEISRAEVTRRFEEHVQVAVVELATGRLAEGIDPRTLDPRRAAQDPETSRPAPANRAGVSRLPVHALAYLMVRRDSVESVVLPFEGVGLWSTMYGLIGLSADLSAVEGITFYEHAETAGLGALISDPTWRELWVGRRPFDDDWRPRLRVIKGRAGPPAESPYEVDGISGATLTGNGVTEAVTFWLGENGWGPYLERYRAERGIS